MGWKPWRTLSLIYLPVLFVIVWWDCGCSSPPPELENITADDGRTIEWESHTIQIPTVVVDLSDTDLWVPPPQLVAELDAIRERLDSIERFSDPDWRSMSKREASAAGSLLHIVSPDPERTLDKESGHYSYAAGDGCNSMICDPGGGCYITSMACGPFGRDPVTCEQEDGTWDWCGDAR